MKKILLLIGLFFSVSSFGQSVESYTSICPNQQDCKKCQPDSRVTFKVSKVNQTVIYSETELSTNKTNSRVMENCSIIDEKNFICGYEKKITRSDGGITNLDSRTIVRDGKLEDNPHIKYMDRNGNFSTLQSPNKICLFKKTLFSGFEVIN